MFIGAMMACFSLIACSPSDNSDNTDNSDVGDTGNTGNIGDTGNVGDTGNTGNTGDSNNGSVAITFSTGIGAFENGKTSMTLNASADGTVAINDAPVADGYAFEGWFNGTQKYSATESYTSPQTFTAKYRSGGDRLVYEALFDENATVSIEMNMSHAEWKKLDADKDRYDKSPIYRMADSVTIGIDDGDGMLYYYYEEVGVRMKGNTSRHHFYDDNGFYDNIHMKLSFKQTFDDIEDGYAQDELTDWTGREDERAIRKARTLGGMEKIDIKYNSTKDETYVRELYAMKTFRENGVVAPNITMCNLSALEKDTAMRNLGVYRIHEPIDEVFIERNLSKLGDTEVGDLWKCTWGNSDHGADMTMADLEQIVGVEDELNNLFYAYDKKTKKKKGFDSVKNFITAINGEDVEFEQYLDIDRFTKMEAVNYILGNPDCIRNNFNNYYLYFRKSDGKAIIIPYDYDRCLGLTYQWDPTGSAAMFLTPYTRQTATGTAQRNPLYVKLIDKGAPTDADSALMKYRANLLDLADSEWMSTPIEFNSCKTKYQMRYGKYTSGAIKTNALEFGATETGNVPVSEYLSTKRNTLLQNIDNYNI